MHRTRLPLSADRQEFRHPGTTGQNICIFFLKSIDFVVVFAIIHYIGSKIATNQCFISFS